MNEKERWSSAAFFGCLFALLLVFISFMRPPIVVVIGSVKDPVEAKQIKNKMIVRGIAMSYHDATKTPVQAAELVNLETFLENHPHERRFLNREEVTPMQLIKGTHITIPGSAVVSFLLNQEDDTIIQIIYIANIEDAMVGGKSEDTDWDSPLYTTDLKMILVSKARPPENRRCVYVDRFPIQQIEARLKQNYFSDEAFRKLFRPIQAKYNLESLNRTHSHRLAEIFTKPPVKARSLHLRALLLLAALMVGLFSAMAFLMSRNKNTVVQKSSKKSKQG